MSRVEEIGRAIESLSREEFAQIAERVRAIEEQLWDADMDRDAASGKLDFLRNEAHLEGSRKLLKDWPPSS